MNSRARCSVCKQYVPQDQIIFSNRMMKACSSECFSILMGKQREHKTKQPSKKIRPAKRMHPVIPIEMRALVHDRDQNICRCCGARGTQCHHVLFRSQGGEDEPSNLILLCAECHMDKAHGVDSRRYRELFRQYIWLLMVEGKSTFVSQLPASGLRAAS